MKKLLTVLFITLGMISTQSFAGAGHGHAPDGSHQPHSSASEGTIIKRATKVMNNLAKKGSIDASWSKGKQVSMEKAIYANGPEWVITFKNDKVKDIKKQMLYIFYSIDGHYIAANYTGK